MVQAKVSVYDMTVYRHLFILSFKERTMERRENRSSLPQLQVDRH